MFTPEGLGNRYLDITARKQQLESLEKEAYALRLQVLEKDREARKLQLEIKTMTHSLDDDAAFLFKEMLKDE